MTNPPAAQQHCSKGFTYIPFASTSTWTDTNGDLQGKGRGLFSPRPFCVGKSLFRKRPAVVAVVDHLLRHTAVHTDILARDKARHIRAKIQHHIGDIQGVPHAPCGLLGGIRAFPDGIVIVDPAGRYGIDTHPPCQTDRHGVRA